MTVSIHCAIIRLIRQREHLSPENAITLLNDYYSVYCLCTIG